MNYNYFKFPELMKYGKKLCIIYRDIERDDKTYSYEEIVNAAKAMSVVLTEVEVKSHQRIAFLLENSPALIALILSILNHNCSFCPIADNIKLEKLSTSLQCYGATYLISSRILCTASNDLEFQKDLEIFNEKIFLYKIFKINEPPPILLCYSIRTSGSTSIPKVVHVPYNSIVPNIEHLSQIYSITADDVILVASPPTFDPFVVEVSLALRNGATLLIIPKKARCSPKILADLTFPTQGSGATIIQMTPSVFKLFGMEVVQKRIFNKESTLRILALGGEPFPHLKEVKLWQNWEDPERKRIFNIYGITEVSCWSSIEEITNDTKEVSLGYPIDTSTFLEVRDLVNNKAIPEGIGEIFIGSLTRKCVLGEESFEILSKTDQKVFRPSGDIGTKTKDGQIFYKGRKDDIVKKFGYQISLQKIEKYFCELNGVEEAICIFWRINNMLIIFYTGKYFPKFELLDFLKNRLDDHEIPDDIIHIDALPLSAHGKISKKKLLELYEFHNNKNLNLGKPQEVFEKLCIKILGRENNGSTSKRVKLAWDISFIAAGGTSFKALQLCKELEEATSKSTSQILLMLLNENYLLSNIIQEIEREDRNSSDEIRSNTSEQIDKFSSSNEIHSELLLSVLWKYDLGKCVDASPKIKNSLVSVGSHSHLLVNLNLEDGKLVSSLKLPDRIESPVEFLEESFAAVGCYDGFLYKFDAKTGTIIWRFDSKGMIKCKALAMGNKIIFGNYAEKENLFCVHSKTGDLFWSLDISSKGIFSSPIKLDHSKVVVCCLDGTIAVIDIEGGKIFWKKQYSFPIFAVCTVIGQHIAVAEISTFKAEGSIFSSFEIIHCSKEKHVICFGCHDNHVYCIEVNKGNPHLKWKTQLPSQVFSTPIKCVINEISWIVACSTNGFVNIISPETGIIAAQLENSGEIFSSPCCSGNKIIVGCRDNNLYCIEINVRHEN